MGVGFGGGSSKSKSKTRDLTPRAFREQREPLASALGGIFQQGGAFGNVSGGSPTLGGGLDPSQFAAGITPQESALVNSIFSSAFGSPETDAASQFRTQTIQGDFLEPDPRTRAAFQRPIIEAFNQAAQEDVGAFTRAGQRVQESSPFFQARGEALSGLANALADTEAQLFEAGRERQFQAAQTAEAQDAQRVSTAVQNLQAIALPRLIADLGIERGLAEFNNRLAVLSQLVQPNLGTFSKGSGFQFNAKA